MARKTILVCDNCNGEIAPDGGAAVLVNFHDPRKEWKRADFCDHCAQTLPGQPTARRGRPRQAAKPEPALS